MQRLGKQLELMDERLVRKLGGELLEKQMDVMLALMMVLQWLELRLVYE